MSDLSNHKYTKHAIKMLVIRINCKAKDLQLRV